MRAVFETGADLGLVDCEKMQGREKKVFGLWWVSGCRHTGRKNSWLQKIMIFPRSIHNEKKEVFGMNSPAIRAY